MQTPTSARQAPSAPRSPYHLTAEQVAFFDENGYLVLRNRIPGPLLERLQTAGHAWIGQGHAVGRDNPNGDYRFAERGGKRVMYCVDYLHSKAQPASLELLGCPQVLAVAESLCRPNFVPTYESMVFKQEGDGAAIPWHQDAVHGRNGRIFNLDVYLDPSHAGAGALRVIPGSQKLRQDVCAVADAYGWDAPGAVDVEMAPGDVLLHDVMVLHGSAHVAGKRLRRTIYYEFRAAEQVRDEGPWNRLWIDQRLRLVPLALRRYGAAFPGAAGFAWRVAPEFAPGPGGSEEEELRVAHTTHTPGSYCSAGSVEEPKHEPGSAKKPS